MRPYLTISIKPTQAHFSHLRLVKDSLPFPSTNPTRRVMNSRAPPAPPPPPPATPSTLLNKYQLGRLLGRGSFAKVYAARSLTDNTVVAVKIIDKAKTDAAMEPRIVCEISAMRRLQQHPNVLKIHEVMATKTKIYLVMELAIGGDLNSKISNRRGSKLKESTARKYFQQIAAALHFCHQNGVSHRDIKPHNILLDERGNIKVSDFGLSSLAETSKDGNFLQTACGTPAFTAPEVMSRRGYDGAKADAWSCGVILYFLVTGSLPYEYGNLAVMYKKISKREYEIPSYVSKPVKSIINQLLDPNPKTRMSIVKLMSNPWFLKMYEMPVRSSLFELDSCRKSYVLASSVNAFDIISMSSGLDLSGLFKAESWRREKRFTSTESVEKVTEKVKEVGERLGYGVDEVKGGGAIGLGKGKVGLVFEVLEIAEKLMVVEVSVVSGGGLVEIEEEKGQWRELKEGLQDVVLQWHNVVPCDG